MAVIAASFNIMLSKLIAKPNSGLTRSGFEDITVKRFYQMQNLKGINIAILLPMQNDPINRYCHKVCLYTFLDFPPLASHAHVMRGVENPKMYTGTPYGNTDLSDHFALEAELRY